MEESDANEKEFADNGKQEYEYKISRKSELEVCAPGVRNKGNNRVTATTSRGMTRTECSNFVQYRQNSGRFENADQHFPGRQPCPPAPRAPFL